MTSLVNCLVIIGASIPDYEGKKNGIALANALAFSSSIVILLSKVQHLEMDCLMAV